MPAFYQAPARIRSSALSSTAVFLPPLSSNIRRNPNPNPNHSNSDAFENPQSLIFPMHNFDRGSWTGVRPYDGGAAERGEGLVVGSGKACSASQTNISHLPPPPGARWGGGTLKSSSSGPAPWRTADGEAKRRRRVAGYRRYVVEGKVKASIRQGIRWIKGLVRGW